MDLVALPLLRPALALFRLARRFDHWYRLLPTGALVASEGLMTAMLWLAVALPVHAFTHSHLSELKTPSVYVFAGVLAVWAAIVTSNVLMDRDDLPRSLPMQIAIATLMGGGTLLIHAQGGTWTDAAVHGTLITLIAAVLLGATLDSLFCCVVALRRRRS